MDDFDDYVIMMNMLMVVIQVEWDSFQEARWNSGSDGFEGDQSSTSTGEHYDGDGDGYFPCLNFSMFLRSRILNSQELYVAGGIHMTAISFLPNTLLKVNHGVSDDHHHDGDNHHHHCHHQHHDFHHHHHDCHNHPHAHQIKGPDCNWIQRAGRPQPASPAFPSWAGQIARGDL